MKELIEDVAAAAAFLLLALAAALLALEPALDKVAP